MKKKITLEALDHIEPWDWPEDAGSTILEVLGDGHAEKKERLLAAELAGEYSVMNDELGGALLGIVISGEEPVELRCEAALALGPALEALALELDDEDDAVLSPALAEQVQSTLRAVHSDVSHPDSVRRSALEASVRSPEEWHREVVRAAYASDDLAWRRTAALCMGHVRGFEAEIGEALNSEDPATLYHAAIAAGAWGLKAAWPRIAALVRDTSADKDLRLAAIEAAPAVDPVEARSVLGELVDETDEDLVAAATEALAVADGGIEWDEEEWDETDDEDDGPQSLH